MCRQNDEKCTFEKPENLEDVQFHCTFLKLFYLRILYSNLGPKNWEFLNFIFFQNNHAESNFFMLFSIIFNFPSLKFSLLNYYMQTRSLWQKFIFTDNTDVYLKNHGSGLVFK